MWSVLLNPMDNYTPFKKFPPDRSLEEAAVRDEQARGQDVLKRLHVMEPMLSTV